jgi:hypothetical protein
MTIVGNATRSSVKVVNYASRVDNYTLENRPDHNTGQTENIID